jgi:DNA-binding transcriptional MerR regulator
MPVTIGGQSYHSHTELADELHVSRQTLWRWREKGKIPTGLRSRSGQVLFTDEEVQMIRDFANRLEPIELGTTPSQMKLFSGSRPKEENENA